MVLGHAEKIQFADMYARYAKNCPPGAKCNPVIDNRNIYIVAAGGKTYHARMLCIEPDRVTIECRTGDAVASKDIDRIEIRNSGRFLKHTHDSAVLPVQLATSTAEGIGDDLAFFPVIAVAGPPVWAYAVASAPFMLAAEFVSLFIPPTTFEIAH